MIRHLFSFFLFIFLFLSVFSPHGYAFPPYLWADNSGGEEEDSSEDTAIDGFGNVYIAGSFSGTASFGDKELVASGGLDIFIAKLDSDGEFLWVKSAGSVQDDVALSIYVNFWGYSYITGYFNDTAVFDDTELVSDGGLDVFIAKLDPYGNFLWAERAGGTGTDGAKSITADSLGNSYITGFYTNNASFGDYELACDGDANIFIAKLDPYGNFIWARKAGGGGYSVGDGIAVDNERNIYITGSFQDTAYFGDTQLISTGGYDIFVAGLDPDGIFQWAKGAGDPEIPNNDSGRDISTDSYQNVYVTGHFYGTVYFDDIALTAYGYENAGDIFVAKLNQNGDFQWVRQAGESGCDGGMGIYATPEGECYVTGYFQDAANFGSITIFYLDMEGQHIFAAKLDTEGNFLWAKGGYGYLLKTGNGIAVDNAGNSYISGYFYDSVIFDSLQIFSSGSTDIFVAKLAYGTSSGPDASIVSQDISISPGFPDPGDTVVITARIRNVGTADIDSGNACFYFSTVPDTDLQYIGNTVFPNIAPGGYTDIVINWESDSGLEQRCYVLTVEITEIEPGDVYAGNNRAYKEIPLPVELGYFQALGAGNKVRINWMTISENDNLGFNVYRLKKGKLNPFIYYSPVKLNDTLIPGQGTSSGSAHYFFNDNVENMAKYIYILESVATSGETDRFRTDLQWIF